MTRLIETLIAFVALLTAVLLPLAALAQTGNANAAPARGTQQRTAILNAIRPSVEARFGGRVEFVVNCLQVNNGWALANVDPQRPGGRAINPSTVPDWEHRDGLTVTAVLRFRNGRWHLVDSAIGATDVWYEGIAPRPLQRSRCY
jgi:hypothetical protein